MKTKFEIGTTYGSEYKAVCIARTDKFVTFDFHAYGECRVKISNHNQNHEAISFKGFHFDASEVYTEEQYSW